ncbi:bacterioferritin comigratory protein [Gloeomargarita lithophora Alchichica-D10]|uniref:thioredoxin-dependent peroxiredoxin n=1 Tax=Gloeomargarita lithophora Alchichica-D10 TaxID=1188229 RepID=A0A1J0A9F4_9CYAN|nr:thioredoxin-dependent thiol peroxidase [Gloeomargarita lithophora]APB32564.1 bacterioferritin comigratory protein [Gloeomargarita lithophora Alchichica-D10]
MSESPALTVGQPAPLFSLPSGDGQTVSLGQFQGQWVILYFYPRDNTPGCTTEACGFRDTYAQLQQVQAVVLGISTDSVASHAKFIRKYDLPFLLLADTGGQVARSYGSYGPKKFMGKSYEGVFRHTFILDPQGKIAQIYRQVKPATHAQQVLIDLTQLQNATP